MLRFTVFFDSDEIPQDFESYKEAREYAEERISWGYASNYTIDYYEVE